MILLTITVYSVAFMLWVLWCAWAWVVLEEAIKESLGIFLILAVWSFSGMQIFQFLTECVLNNI